MRLFFKTDLDFPDVTVKGAYDELPEIKYPLVTILEIRNDDNSRFRDTRGSHVSNLGYQFDSISGNRGEEMATDVAMRLSAKVDYFLKTYDNGKYLKLRRTDRNSILPLTTDITKIKSSTTYECSIDIDKNIIYDLS